MEKRLQSQLEIQKRLQQQRLLKDLCVVCWVWASLLLSTLLPAHESTIETRQVQAFETYFSFSFFLCRSELLADGNKVVVPESCDGLNLPKKASAQSTTELFERKLEADLSFHLIFFV